MYTREDFMKEAERLLSKYPTLSVLSKVGDPRLKHNLESVAGMLAMYSSQVEVSTAEAFEKVRDSTVLADAAMRGIIPKATPARLVLAVTNKGASVFQIDASRGFADNQGLDIRGDATVSVPAGATVALPATQIYTKTTTHSVTESRPFYEVEIDLADDDAYLCGLSVSDVEGEMECRERYVNCGVGDRIYHIEADDRQRIYIRFGLAGVVGIQPIEGSEITITAHYCAGDATFKHGSPVVFSEMRDPYETNIELLIQEVSEAGSNPIGIQTLRELAKYPSIYNDNAVFLGEFEYLVRRNFPDLKFCRVWNETAEERARGVSFTNTNSLFVACFSALEDEPVLYQAPGEVVAPYRITDLTGTQQAIKAKILAADDSYRVQFVTAVRAPIGVSITASVSSSYEKTTVEQQIVSSMLDAFGESSGRSVLLYQQVYKLLREKVPALAVGQADLILSIGEQSTTNARPELWRYVTEQSMNVAVTVGNVSSPNWGAGFE